jgi:hypothetical protein
MGLLVGLKYGGDFVGPETTTIVMKALQEPGKKWQNWLW